MTPGIAAGCLGRLLREFGSPAVRESEQRNLLAEDGLSSSQKTSYEFSNMAEPRPIDDIVKRSGLNSSVVLATLVLFREERDGAADPRQAVPQGVVVNRGVRAL